MTANAPVQLAEELTAWAVQEAQSTRYGKVTITFAIHDGQISKIEKSVTTNEAQIAGRTSSSKGANQ